MPKLRAEDATAVHRLAALPLQDELEKGHRVLWTVPCLTDNEKNELFPKQQTQKEALS